MKQKKTMRLWQMLTILILSVVLLITMFLPAYHINPDTLQKGMEKAQAEENYYKDDAERDKDIKWYKKKFNKALKKEKKENETDNSTISGLKLMTKSLTDIRYNGKYDEDYAKSKNGMGEEIYNALNKKHTMTRVLLWMVYGVLLVVMLLTVLGYCLRWNKYIPLIIDAVYGALAAVSFAVLRFGTISGVNEEVRTLTENLIGYEFNNINTDKFTTGFVSVAFLVGMLVALAILVTSVLSMFFGKQIQENSDEENVVSDSLDDWDGDWNPGPPEKKTDFQPGGKNILYSGDQKGVDPFVGSSDVTIPVNNQVQHVTPQNLDPQPFIRKEPVRQREAAGKVQCTKGTTSGAVGYTLPQDRKVVVGKSPRQANLVIVNNERISNVHCTIRYSAATNSYTVRDHSTNGTFVNGVRLPKESVIEYPAGTVLSLADGKVEITLG